MTTTPRRTIAAAITALALTTPVVLSTAASAAPDEKPAATTTPQTKQLVRAITVKDARLERLSTADRTAVLADENEAGVVSNIVTDRKALATLKSEAEAADSTLDTRAVRTELRDFRVLNYVLSTNILRQAEAIADEAAADPEAVAHLDEAVAAAQAITACSTKSDVRDARAHLRLAKNELDEVEVEDEVEAPAPTT
jgi:hypothetical protein